MMKKISSESAILSKLLSWRVEVLVIFRNMERKSCIITTIDLNWMESYLKNRILIYSILIILTVLVQNVRDSDGSWESMKIKYFLIIIYLYLTELLVR